MLDNILDNKILFIDIETVPEKAKHSELSDIMKKLWEKKSEYFRKEQTAEEVYQKAGIYAEFGKIVCISTGFIALKKDGQKIIRIKSFYGDNEKKLLTEFKQLLERAYNSANKFLCAHNGKEFDFPYTARRMLINGIKLPKILDLAGKKPWEIKHLDTLELWKFGDYKNYTSLEILTTIFNIPTPKDDIDGSMVASVYWEEKDLDRIVTYCEKDVVAIIQLYFKYKCKNLIPEDNIFRITS